MISTVTTTTTGFVGNVSINWAVYLIAGILYHYYKTQEYKRIIKGSIVIGVILGFILGLFFYTTIQGVLVEIIIAIIFVSIGGLIEVGLKKTVNE